MERANYISGSTSTRGCSAVCRFLKQVGAQLLGVPELAETTARSPWWGEISEATRYRDAEARMSSSSATPRQVEFWVDSDLKIPSGRKEDEMNTASTAGESMEKEEMPAPRRESVRIPEKTMIAENVQPDSKKRRGGARLDRGAMRSVLGITRFLSINGSLSDGREGGRWLALPGRRNGPRYKLMQTSGGAPLE